MIILDSDFLIDFFNGLPAAVEKAKSISGYPEKLATTIFNVQEVLYGYPSKGKADKGYMMAMDFFMQIQVLNYEWGAMEKTISVKRRLKERGSSIGVFDEMIGGICLAHGASILTRNSEHFSKIEGLKMITY